MSAKPRKPQFDGVVRKPWLERVLGYLPDRASGALGSVVDPTIWDMAILYVDTYGDEALLKAQERAAEFLKADDRECYALRTLITDVIEVLQERKSGGG